MASLMDLPDYFIYGTMASYVGTVICFSLARKLVVPKLLPDAFRQRVEALSTKDRLNFYSLIPSTVHALIQIMFHPAWISLGYSPEHTADRVHYFDETWPSFFSGVFVGYLLADYSLLPADVLGTIFTVHHLSASACWILSGHSRIMQYYASFLQFCEFSTLFMNARQVVLTAGYSSSSSVASFSSLGLFVSFFLVRVLPLPKIVYDWLTTDCVSLYEKHGLYIAMAFSLFLTIHVGLQSFWFSLMVKKIIGIVAGKPIKKKE